MTIQTPLPRPGFVRVGHKGADHVVQGNTLESFDAARAIGVDMVEFDVARAVTGEDRRLLLAHDPQALAAGGCGELGEALAHLAGPAFAGLELDVDLKLPGYELEVLDALREHGLIERSLVSSCFRESLAVLRAAEPALRLGWSVPKVKRDWTASPVTRVPALLVAGAYRAALPARAAAHLRDGRIDALMSYWRLVTPALVRAVHGAGGVLYVWTVDDGPQIATLAQMGVDGIISNDPRLFAAAAAHPG
jgi:glycerophosphoryl diester phosphodiesterase